MLCQSAHETEFPATGLEGNAAAHSQTVRGTSDERLQLYDGPPSGGARRGAKLAETPAILLRGGSGHRRAGQPIDNEALGEGSLDTKTKLRTLSLMRTFLVSSLCLLAALVAVSVTAANPESVAPSGTIAAGGPGIRGIYLIPASGRPPRRVGAPDGPVESVDFSPDGRRVAFAGSNGLWVMRRDGSRAKLIFDTRRKQYVPTQVAWSPDGRRLVFISNEQLFTISATGIGIKWLTTGAAAPDWSADSRRIVFVRNPARSTGVGMISSIDSDGHNLRAIVRGADPDVSPDGSKLVFWRSGGGIYVVPIGGGRPKLVLRHGLHPEWSPAGRHLAFARHVFCDAACEDRVFIAPANGGKAKAYGPWIVDIGPLSWSR